MAPARCSRHRRRPTAPARVVHWRARSTTERCCSILVTLRRSAARQGRRCLGAPCAHGTRRLDFFVMYSRSLRAGLSRQSNHASANAFLYDCLVSRAQGLPALSISWGAGARRCGRGRASTSASRAGHRRHRASAGLRCGAATRRSRSRRDRRRFPGPSTRAARPDWPPLLRSREPSQRRHAAISRAAPAAGALDVEGLRPLRAASAWPYCSLSSRTRWRGYRRSPVRDRRHSNRSGLGLDSLMAVDLRNRLNRASAKSGVYPRRWSSPPTLDALARHLSAIIAPAPATPNVEHARRIARHAGRHRHASDEQIDALFAERSRTDKWRTSQPHQRIFSQAPGAAADESTACHELDARLTRRSPSGHGVSLSGRRRHALEFWSC